MASETKRIFCSYHTSARVREAAKFTRKEKRMQKPFVTIAMPCLNEHPIWIDALEAIAREEGHGWL